MTRGECEQIVDGLLSQFRGEKVVAIYLPDARPGETYRGHPVRPGNIAIGIQQELSSSASSRIWRWASD